MTARKLEEFINLIETAEKISHNESIPPVSLPRSAQVHHHSTNTSARPSTRTTAPSALPNLRLPLMDSQTSTPHRFVGPPASHCGLTLSDVPSPAPAGGSFTSAATTERVTARSSLEQRRGSVVSVTPERKDSVTSVASHAETIMNLQKNAPFVRRISQEMLPASSDDR